MAFFFNLPISLQTAIKGLAAIAVIIPFAGACSMAERKVSAWIQGRPGPNRAIVPWVAWIPFLGRFLQRLGVFHLMADGGKFVFKENVVPAYGQIETRLWLRLWPPFSKLKSRCR